MNEKEVEFKSLLKQYLSCFPFDRFDMARMLREIAEEIYKDAMKERARKAGNPENKCGKCGAELDENGNCKICGWIDEGNNNSR